jgi:hypothetical protein
MTTMAVQIPTPVIPYGLHPVARPDFPSPESFDFYRCQRCKRLFTRLEELKALQTGKVCPCGGLKYVGPAWPHPHEWFLPRVILFAYLRWQGRA